MVASLDRTGVLILRIWTEGGQDELRLRITMVDDLAGGAEEQRVAASVEEAVAAVRQWLESWSAPA
jgi:hypothetical protein